MKQILKGIIEENPIFVLVLGLCSALAITNKFENAYIMGLCLLIVLIFSNIIISLIRKLVPDNVKIPVFILIIGTFVTVLELLLSKFIPAVYKKLGVYLPLIVVNCIVLGRALSVASKKDVKTSFQDAITIGLGYIFALCLIALIREVLGSGTITLMDNISSITGYRSIIKLPTNNIFPMSIFSMSSGAFLTLGLLSGLINKIREDKNESN